MKSGNLHPWEVTPAEAERIQERLRHAVLCRDDFAQVTSIAGVDVGFVHGGAVAVAAIALLGFPDLDLRAHALACRELAFPYIPGLLAFRLAPAVLAAWAQLPEPPDLLVCHGHGLAHPRRFGLACHLGLWTGVAAIGVAESVLVGRHDPPGVERGSWTPLIDRGETVGAAVRTRRGVRPVYVSPGHRIGLESAIRYVLASATGYRIPEPIRRARALASAFRRMRL